MQNIEALYKNICVNPLDDTLRLIFADCLEEQGDENSIRRAEYIRLSVSMQFPPDDANFAAIAEWDERYKKCREMMLTYGKNWIDPKCRLCDLIANDGCKGCFGLGDIYHMRGRFTNVKARELEYERGMPVSVTCHIEEVFPRWNEVSHEIIDIPIDISEWCKQIVQTTPITRFMIDDLLPHKIRSGRRGSTPTVFRWVEYLFRWIEYTGNTTEMTGVLPVWLFELVWKDAQFENRTDYKTPIVTQRFLEYQTAQEARMALSSAIGREVRRRVYETGT